MGRSYARPVHASLLAGAAETIYIPLNRHASRTHISVVITGANTFSIDSTQDTILWDDTAAGAVNINGYGTRDDIVAPANAQWAEEQASASASSDLHLNSPVAAIAIVKSAGAGTAVVRIQQA